MGCFFLPFLFVVAVSIALFWGLAAAVYALSWTGATSILLHRASSPTAAERLDASTALGLAMALAAVRTVTGSATLLLLADVWSSTSRNDALWPLATYGVPVAEAVALAGITTLALRSVGAPWSRAVVAGVLLEVASFGLSRLVPLRGWAEGVVAGTFRAEVPPLVQWDPASDCGIDERGALWCSGQQPAAGTFTAVEGTCAVRADGSAWCAGGEVPAGPVAKLVEGKGKRIALTRDGRVWAPSYHPDAYGFAGLAGVRDVAIGPGSACVVDAGGAARCVTFQGTSGEVHAPREAPGGPRTAVAVAMPDIVCALDPAGEAACTGSISCWGPPPPGPFVSLRVGPDEACALRADATAACWGRPDRLPTRPGPFRDLRPSMGERGGVDAAGRLVREGNGTRPCELVERLRE